MNDEYISYDDNNNGNNNSEPTYVCTRCGNNVKLSSRYCMKCGQLNLSHPENQRFIQMANVQNNNNFYQVGKGSMVQTGDSNNGIITSSATDTGNVKLCFMVNIILYLVFLIIGILISISGIELSLEGILSSNLSIVLVSISLSFLLSYSFQQLYVKSNHPWWNVFIPIYNIMVLSEIAFQKKGLGLLIFLPIIGEIYLLLLYYKLGKKFQYSGILSVLFFPIIVLFIAFGHHYYEGHLFVQDNESIEKTYKRNKSFLTVVLLFLFIGIVLIVIANLSTIMNFTNTADDYYYVNAAKKIVEKTKKATENDKVICNNGKYKEKGSTYYFYFPDVGDEVYLPLYLNRDETISSYVIVTFLEDGTVLYGIHLSDGKKMVQLESIDGISKEDVVDTNQRLNSSMISINNCKIQ